MGRRIAVIGMLLAAAGADAHAREIAGVEFAPTAQVGGRTLTLNGVGVRSFAIFDVYAAGLYVPSIARSSAALLAQTGPRRVAMTLLRDVDGAQISDAVTGGLEDNHSEAELRELAPQIATLEADLTAIGAVREGDAIVFEYTPEAGTRILRNGRPVGGAIAGEDFFRAVLRVWIGEAPVDDDLKRGLLGP